jgi:hypothetical protein
LHDGSGNQVDFSLGHNAGGEEGKAPVGSIAGIFFFFLKKINNL